MASQIIWILEDDIDQQFTYSESLADKYDLEFFSTLLELQNSLNAVGKRRPELLLADLRLPDGSFYHFIKQQEVSFQFPIMIVSSIDDIDILKDCFDKGAKDYLTKPFNWNALVVKIKNILNKPTIEDVANKFNVKINANSREIMSACGNKTVLTPKEYQLFLYLLEGDGHRRKKESIILNVLGESLLGTKTFDVHLSNLRRKLKVVKIGFDFDGFDFYKVITHKE